MYIISGKTPKINKKQGCNYSRTIIFHRYYSGVQLLLLCFFAPFFNFIVLYTFLPAKNTGTYSSKKPAIPHKIKVSSIVSRQSQHGLRGYQVRLCSNPLSTNSRYLSCLLPVQTINPAFYNFLYPHISKSAKPAVILSYVGIANS